MEEALAASAGTTAQQMRVQQQQELKMAQQDMMLAHIVAKAPKLSTKEAAYPH